MSTSEKLKHATKPLASSAPTPDELRYKLAEQEERLAGLKSQAEDAAYKLASGEPDAATSYQETSTRVQAAEQVIESLRRAIPASERRVQAEQARALQAVNASQIASTHQRLIARLKVARTLEKALSEAVEAWKELCRLSQAAQHAAPSRPPYPVDAGLAKPAAINLLISHELYRLACDPSLLSQSQIFPGARPASLATSNSPDGMKPLVEKIEEANKHIMSVIRGEYQIDEPSVPEDFTHAPGLITEHAYSPTTETGPQIAADAGPDYQE